MLLVNHDEYPLTRFTVGVELEFILLVLCDGEQDPHEAQKDQLPPVLRVPLNTADDEWDTGGETQKFAEEAIKDLLRENGFPVDVSKVGSDRWSLALGRLKAYEAYEVKYDPTIGEPDPRGYRLTRLEITSPVQFESPDSYKAIAHLVDLLCSSYRIIVNPSCGLHVHVGNKKAEHMSLAHVKRLSSFLWAADPLLAMLHPPRRRQNEMCQSIRGRTPLAHDTIGRCEHDAYSTGWTCRRYIGTNIRFGEESPLWRESHREPATIAAFEETRKPGCYAPFFDDSAPSIHYIDGPRAPSSTYGRPIQEDWPQREQRDPNNSSCALVVEASQVPKTSGPPGPARTRRRPRFRLPNPTKDQIQRYVDQNNYYSESFGILKAAAAQDLGVFEGVKRIFEASSSCQIKGLLWPSTRPNYNFGDYGCVNMIDSTREAKRTVEWREAEGSLEAQWVIMWCRIVVGLTRFAVYAPVVEFLGVLKLCNEATNEDGIYDVIDLLDATGLFVEAEFVEEKLAKLAKEYDLEYVD